MFIGEKIKLLRIEKNLSQEQLGSLIGVKRSEVSKYEAGERIPPIHIVISLARVFRVSTDYLLNVKSSDKDKLIFDVSELTTKQRESVAHIVFSIIKGFIE
ncbi:helix-turn-helix domain-containing protein [Anaerotruncus colihominis]|uniref:helix-turn-helix domain-containing protein n=1 Tax=Anaerotruncus colihominis TaxID=169435 RepID=UPI00189977FF|nr:helix-turn-helix transcriptional regulator [Anaerotruncus colihominis]MBS4860690.1 helix-turn-helix transcriptional regulator [Eubacterium limosum]